MKGMIARLNRLCLLLVVAAGIVLPGCYTVPITGRQAMILMDEGTEMQMGASSYAEIKGKTEICTDPAINAQARRVGSRVAAATGLNYDWEFTVFDDTKTVNAFCLPGGKVGIYAGILQIAQNDAGLATIIAHEAAHATARHGAERYSQELMLGLGGAIIGEAIASGDKETQDSEKWKVAYGLASTLFVALPHSRMQESEADRMGLVYMAKAGYDPRAAVGVWERFKKYKDERGDTQIEFLSTHPTDETRINDIKSQLPEALRYYHAATEKEAPLETALVAVPVVKPAVVAPSATMFLRAQCPYCAKVNRVPFSSYHGQGIRCFSCGRTFE